VFVMGEGPVITAGDLPPEVRGQREPGDTRVPRRKERERERILRALTAHRGRKSDAARALGISRSTLWRKLAKHGLD